MAPDPRDYADLAAWLATALKTRGESPERASKSAGLSRNALRAMLTTGRAERPSLDKVAAYFGVDAAELRAFITKSPGRVAAGKANAERLGLEHMQAIAAEGREKAALISPEERTRVGKIAGAASWRRKSPEERQAMVTAGAAARRAKADETGSWFSSEETRAAAIPKLQEAGRRGGQATLDRYGTEHMSRAGTLAAERKRNGAWLVCLFCGDPDRLIYRNKSQQERRRLDDEGEPGRYHRECYEDWRRTLPLREQFKDVGTVGWIWSRVKLYGDEGLKEWIGSRVKAQLADLREQREGHRAPGRPATLLSDRHRAIEAARLRDDLGMPKGDIALQLGLRVYRNESRYTKANRYIDRWIELGRVLRGRPGVSLQTED